MHDPHPMELKAPQKVSNFKLSLTTNSYVERVDT